MRGKIFGVLVLALFVFFLGMSAWAAEDFVLNGDFTINTTGTDTPNDWANGDGDVGKSTWLSSFDGKTGVMHFADNGANISQSWEGALFQDDFNDNNIDPLKWTIFGNTVTETGGILKVDNTVTDHMGFAYTSWFNIDPNAPLMITRKLKVHYANDYSYPALYFQVDGDSTKYAAGIGYLNDIYQGTFYGFYIVKQPIACVICNPSDSRSTAITPIWDAWFNEKIIYHPNTGLLEYFINDIKQKEFTVGTAISKMRLIFDANGWYTGHYQYFDNLSVSQGELNKPPVITSFTADPTTGVSPLTVKFQCDAKDPDGSIAKYSWVCGDGKTISTTADNASYTYTKPGTYKARVKVVDNDGGATTSKLVTITVSSTHSISGKVKTGTASPIPGVTINLTGAASRTTSTDSNGNYALSELKNGVYTITPDKDQYTFDPANRSVNINGANASSQNFTGTLLGITVISPNGGESWPIGSSQTIKWVYSGDVGSNARIDLLKGGLLAGTIVQSTSIGSAGNGSYTWLIPSNVPSGADYRIGITSVANSSYKDTSDNTFTIAASAPNAGFSAEPTSGDAPLTVQFTDQSTGEITSRVWDFGDWTTSTEQHPTHTYTNPGSYGVSLNVTGPGGSGSEVKSNFITVNQPTTKYTLTVTKNGTGVGKVTSSPKGIDCGADCSEQYSLNTSVVLTAVPDTSSVFSGWSGSGCSGTGECSISMTENCSVTAKFDPRSSNKPDLVMTVFSAPVTAVAGQTIQMPNTVKNQGKVSAGPFTIGIYLSQDKVLSPTGDILLESRDRVGLGVGQSSTAATSVKIPANITIGTYYIGAMADTKNAVEESSETNNTRVAPKMIQIVSPLPDLIVTDVSGPITASLGQTIEVFDGIKNAGKSDAKDAFLINLYLSKDTKINMIDDIYLGNHGLAGLSVGQTARRKTEVTIPSDIEPGTYYLGTLVDSEDTILESNENNNSKSSIATIQIK